MSPGQGTYIVNLCDCPKCFTYQDIEAQWGKGSRAVEERPAGAPGWVHELLGAFKLHAVLKEVPKVKEEFTRWHTGRHGIEVGAHPWNDSMPHCAAFWLEGKFAVGILSWLPEDETGGGEGIPEWGSFTESQQQEALKFWEKAVLRVTKPYRKRAGQLEDDEEEDDEEVDDD